MTTHGNQETQQPTKVLIVDNDVSYANWLSEKCRLHGFDVSTARDGVEAVECMDYGYPDLMILSASIAAFNEKSFLQFLDMPELKFRVPMIVLCPLADLHSVYRSKNVRSYYVHKSRSAWNRIKIFAQELVDVVQRPINKSTELKSKLANQTDIESRSDDFV